jgi:pyrroloquinoline-quinone synthase
MSERPGRTRIYLRQHCRLTSHCRGATPRQTYHAGPPPINGDDVKTIWQRIENARDDWNVLKHPFYLRWSAGELSRQELASYAGQYRHATQAIARLSEQAADAAPESDRHELLHHAEEETEHVALWDGFVEAVGGKIGAEPTPETRTCVDAWTAEDALVPSLVRLYAIESGQPEISRVKREGLAEHYGVGDGDGNAYFRVHERLDVEHAAAGRELIERHLDADEDVLVAAAESAFRANWRLLDGV